MTNIIKHLYLPFLILNSRITNNKLHDPFLELVLDSSLLLQVEPIDVLVPVETHAPHQPIWVTQPSCLGPTQSC